MPDDVENIANTAVMSVSAKGMDILQHAKVFDIDFMEVITIFGAFDDSWSRTWSSRFEECRIVSEKMVDRPYRAEDALSPLEIEQWRNEMKTEFATALKAWGSDWTHWMPLYGFLFPSASLSYRAINPAWTVKQMVVPGRFMIIDGDLDSGKTDASMRWCQTIAEVWEDYERNGTDSDLVALMEELDGERGDTKDTPPTKKLDLLHSKGPRFVSNVNVPDGTLYSNYFQFCTRLSDMIIHMAQNALDGYFSILILDEMGMNYNKKRGTSRNNFSLEGIFRLIRKFRTSAIIITQNKELDLPAHLTRPDRGAKTVVEKISRTVALITVQGVAQLHHQRVHGIPGTTIKYDTQAVASLAIDVDPRTLVEETQLIEATERAKGVKWTIDDSFAAIISYCRHKQDPTANSASMNQALRQKALAMLQSINIATGDHYSTEDVMEELGVSEEFIQECQGVIHAVSELKTPPVSADEVVQERVVALLTTGLPIEEVARLAGVDVEFVELVKKKQTIDPKNLPPPDPSESDDVDDPPKPANPPHPPDPDDSDDDADDPPDPPPVVEPALPPVKPTSASSKAKPEPYVPPTPVQATPSPPTPQPGQAQAVADPSQTPSLVDEGAAVKKKKGRPSYPKKPEEIA